MTALVVTTAAVLAIPWLRWLIRRYDQDMATLRRIHGIDPQEPVK